MLVDEACNRASCPTVGVRNMFVFLNGASLFALISFLVGRVKRLKRKLVVSAKGTESSRGTKPHLSPSSSHIGS